MAHDHMDFIEGVVREDIAALREKERTYRGSWKKRGGVGVFMMLARKWDRLESILNQLGRFGGGEKDASPYDIFKWIEREVTSENEYGRSVGCDGTVLAEVRDLRRYLLLVEGEMAARGVIREGPPAATDAPVPASPPKVAGVSGERRVELWSTPYLRAQLQDLGRSPPSPVGNELAARIRAELIRRGSDATGWREAPVGSGTPEDGGHHARYNPNIPGESESRW